MEAIIARAAFTVYWIFAAFAFAGTAYNNYRQNTKITFEVITDAVWSICHITMPYIISTDLHGLFDIKTASKICLGLYTMMIFLAFAQIIMATVKKFKTKEYVAGTGMVIACIFFAMFTSVPPLILYQMC